MGSIRAPFSRGESFSSSTASRIPVNTSLGFSPRRMTAMPSTPPLLPFSPNTPVCGAALNCTVPTWRRNTGVPPLDATTTFSMSVTERISPNPRTISACWPLGRSEPPAF